MYIIFFYLIVFLISYSLVHSSMTDLIRAQSTYEHLVPQGWELITSALISDLRNSRMGRTKLSCLFEYKQIYTIIIHIIMVEKVLSLKQNRGHFLDCPLEWGCLGVLITKTNSRQEGGGALTSDQVFIGTNEGCLMESLP